MVPYRVVIFPSRKLSGASTSASAWVSLAGSLGQTDNIPITRNHLEFVFQVGIVYWSTYLDVYMHYFSRETNYRESLHSPTLIPTKGSVRGEQSFDIMYSWLTIQYKGKIMYVEEIYLTIFTFSLAQKLGPTDNTEAGSRQHRHLSQVVGGACSGQKWHHWTHMEVSTSNVHVNNISSAASLYSLVSNNWHFVLCRNNRI